MRRFALLVAMGIAFAAAAGGAQAAWPARPVHVLVGFLSGSPPDVFARLFGEALTAATGQPVIVENVAGAAGSVAAARLAKAAADGYTLGVLTEAPVLLNPSLYALSYRPETDLAPVSQLFSSPNLLVVGADDPARTLTELLEEARARPGALTFASGGNGSTAHLAGELLRSQASVDVRHVPYRGLLAAVPDLVSGRVRMAFSPVGLVLPLVREGKLRALAVTSASRIPAAPEVPTTAELGYPKLQIAGWAGLFAPAGTPPAIVQALHEQVQRTLAQPQVQARLAALALEPIGSTPAQLQSLIRVEGPRWAALIHASGIQAEQR